MKDKIVVGVDGSEGSNLALRWALKEAECRGGTVTAVATWHWEVYDESLVDVTGPQAAREHAVATLQDNVNAALAEWSGPPPSVAREVVQGRPAELLVRAAADADLLVLGSHGHSRLRHRALGSVSEACIQHATCPVVVVPLPHGAHRKDEATEKLAR